jgi:hypothetical protein
MLAPDESLPAKLIPSTDGWIVERGTRKTAYARYSMVEVLELEKAKVN